MTSDEPIPTPAHGSPRSAAAYEELLPEILAVTEENLSPILIDIPRAVTTVLGALPRIRALRPEIVENLPRFDLGEFDRLGRYTLALSHAHALHRAAYRPSSSLGAMARELIETRAMLLSDARSLASHGLVDAGRLDGCRARPGYRALAYDVLLLVELLKEAWNTVEDRTPVTLAELESAAVAAEDLLTAVGLRDRTAPTVPEATTIRRKAFSLFLRVYARARAAVQYLRAEVGDAGDIAPSLYAGRTKRRTSGAEPPETGPASSEPETDPAAVSPPPGPWSDDVAAAPERPTAADAAQRPGHRGSNPLHSPRTGSTRRLPQRRGAVLRPPGRRRHLWQLTLRRCRTKSPSTSCQASAAWASCLRDASWAGAQLPVKAGKSGRRQGVAGSTVPP